MLPGDTEEVKRMAGPWLEKSRNMVLESDSGKTNIIIMSRNNGVARGEGVRYLIIVAKGKF